MRRGRKTAIMGAAEVTMFVPAWATASTAWGSDTILFYLYLSFKNLRKKLICALLKSIF
jgi:hypothetical protein